MTMGIFIFSLLLSLGSLIQLCHGTATRDFARLHTEVFAWQLEQNPVSATARDVHRYDDQVESFNMADIQERKTTADGFLARLKNISMSDLSQQDVTNYRILDDMLSTYVNGWEWFYYQHLNPVSFRGGPQTLDTLYLYLPFNTRGDFENYIARLKKYPNQMEEMKDLMREAVRLGRTNNYHSMSRLQDQFERVLVPLNESGFYKPFTNQLVNMSMDAADKEDLIARGEAAINTLLDALRNFWTFLQDDYMPHTRPGIGMSSLEGGLEFYEACIRWYLSEERSAQEVHDIGLREVERITRNMQEIMQRQQFEGTPGDYYRSFGNDTSFTYKTGEDLLEEYRRIIFDVIDDKLPPYFSNIPDLPLEVREMLNDGPRGGYSTGSADGTRPGIFWANVKRPEETLNFTLRSLVLHEANPGHHFQLSISITSDTPDFRQQMIYSDLYKVPFAFPVYTSFVEGWALYTEYLGEEMGIYDNDYELMGRYSDEIFRACRLVVDTGIHAFNWSRDESVEYFLNYTASSRAAIEVEVDRYITWPGQALAYKIGEIKIKELRTKAEKELGDHFDIREFHAIVLDSGTVPLNVLEQHVNDWIESYPMGEPDSPPTCAGQGLGVSSFIMFLSLLMFIPF